jgi:hypothetical protein
VQLQRQPGAGTAGHHLPGGGPATGPHPGDGHPLLPVQRRPRPVPPPRGQTRRSQRGQNTRINK